MYLVGMRDRDLYARILGLSDPWCVSDVELDESGREVRVYVELSKTAKASCPECAEPSSIYDYRERRWRHLDTCQYRTILVAQVPRVQCKAHGVRQIIVPWSEPHSRFTALFEALVIDWLRETTISAVARNLDMSWDEVDGIQSRAVQRGLARRQLSTIEAIGVDETSFRKRHEYITVVSDLDLGDVVHVDDDRNRETLDGFFECFDEEELAAIRFIAMDMWKPYVLSALEHVPEAEKKICFDKFHVAKHLGDAVDKVRRDEHRQLMELGDTTLKGSKYVWLKRPDKLKPSARKVLRELRTANLKTARAWAIRETGMQLWGYVSRAWAKKAWKRWLSWATRCKLDPIKKAARMIREHLWGIINAIVHQATNAGSESMNAKIQRIKKRACGFRNRQRFQEAIYFHLGGLDLYPAAARRTHTDS
jgi:transposase